MLEERKQKRADPQDPSGLGRGGEGVVGRRSREAIGDGTAERLGGLAGGGRSVAGGRGAPRTRGAPRGARAQLLHQPRQVLLHHPQPPPPPPPYSAARGCFNLHLPNNSKETGEGRRSPSREQLGSCGRRKWETAGTMLDKKKRKKRQNREVGNNDKKKREKRGPLSIRSMVPQVALVVFEERTGQESCSPFPLVGCLWAFWVHLLTSN